MKELREQFETDLTLIESKNPNILKHLKFNYVRAEKLNANNRVYPESVISKDAERFNDALKKSGVSGQLNHPKIAGSELDKISHVLTGVSYNPKTKLGVAEAAILNTSKGKDLLTLINSNVKLGASMRGFGTVASNRRVNDNFKLLSIDLVENPSFGSDTMISKFNLIESGNSIFNEIEEEFELEDLGEEILNNLIQEVENLPSEMVEEMAAEDGMAVREEILEGLQEIKLDKLKEKNASLKKKLNKKADEEESLTEAQIEEAREEFLAQIKRPGNQLNEEEKMEKNKEIELRKAYIEARTWGFLKEGETFEQFAEKMLEAEKNLGFDKLTEQAKQEEKKLEEENQQLIKDGVCGTPAENIEYEQALFSGFEGNFSKWKETMEKGKRGLEEQRKLEEAEPVSPEFLIEQAHLRAKDEITNLNKENIRKGQLKKYHSDIEKGIFEGSFVEFLMLAESKIEGAKKLILEREFEECVASGFGGTFQEFLKLQKK